VPVLSSAGNGFWFGVHVAFVATSVATYLMALLSGLAYLWVQRQLKRKQLDGFGSRLPSLETFDRWVSGALRIGSVALTISLATGIYYAHEVWTMRNWPTDPKVLVSFLTWIWYLLLLVVRHRFGWRGSRFVTLMVVGFLLLLLTFIGSATFWLPKAGME